MRQWIVPVVLAIAAAAAVYVLDPLAEDPAPPPERPIAVFEEGPVGDRPRDVLVIANASRTGPAELPIDDTHAVQAAFIGPVGLVNATACDCPPGPFVLRPVPDDAPRARQDGHVGVRVTMYVFNEDGELVASNAPLHERGRFRLYGDFFAVPDRVWHVGDGKTPDGMEELPFFGDQARALVGNETVGSHMAARFEQHELAWALGPVTVTARIDALVQA